MSTIKSACKATAIRTFIQHLTIRSQLSTIPQTEKKWWFHNSAFQYLIALVIILNIPSWILGQDTVTVKGKFWAYYEIFLPRGSSDYQMVAELYPQIPFRAFFREDSPEDIHQVFLSPSTKGFYFSDGVSSTIVDDQEMYRVPKEMRDMVDANLLNELKTGSFWRKRNEGGKLKIFRFEADMRVVGLGKMKIEFLNQRACRKRNAWITRDAEVFLILSIAAMDYISPE